MYDKYFQRCFPTVRLLYCIFVHIFYAIKMQKLIRFFYLYLTFFGVLSSGISEILYFELLIYIRMPCMNFGVWTWVVCQSFPE